MTSSDDGQHRLRPAESGDAETITRIARSAYAIYVPRIGREPSPMLADHATLLKEATVWVAEHEQSTVGFIVVRELPGHLLVESIAVMPSEQSRGVGAALLSRAERVAVDAGLGEVRLYTNEVMTENIAYYGRRGYVETHRATDDGYRRVFFTKTLA